MNKWICDICNDDLYNHFVLARGQKLSKKSCLASPTCMRKNSLALVAGQWISVHEMMPPLNEKIVAFDADDNQCYIATYRLDTLDKKTAHYSIQHKGGACSSTWPFLVNVTHWMSVPSLLRNLNGS